MSTGPRPAFPYRGKPKATTVGFRPRFGLAISEEQLDAVDKWAKLYDRSVSSECRILIQEALDARQKKGPRR